MINDLLINEWIKNGASLDKDLQPITKKSGFMVSLLGYEKTFDPADTEAIKNAIIQYKSLLKACQFVGIWQHEGLVYIDISRHYTNKQDAIRNGVKNKQLAIFDLKSKNDIYLTKKVYIVYKYNKIKNDITYIKEFTTLKALEKATNKKRDTLKHYMIKSIDDPVNELLFNKYLIVIDNAFIRDL